MHVSSTRRANSQRKKEHLDIVLSKSVVFDGLSTGLENCWFVHQALPEIDLAEIDLSMSLTGKVLKAPLLISSMVGGIEAARPINQRLAEAAQTLGIAMGVGSQRCAIDDPRVAVTYQVRNIAPDIPLFANLGAVQLNYLYGVDECKRVVDMIEADALVLHLNPLQEALQEGGNTNFSGLLANIEKVCREITVPVFVKEVGYGISENVACKLAGIGVAGIDVTGAGGTSWSEVERHRTGSRANIASSFASWGIPTAESVQMGRRGAPLLTLIASGGIRNGIDVAKSIALGADMAGMAAPLLKAASLSAKAVMTALEEIIETLRICMFCIGAANLGELKNSPFLKKEGRW
ncbi:MAG: type 2 isopentenyl-diphosphate Delta-isomerase [Dehalococcoidia bacterium]|nr:type 2 isopentenyl-diphosphate Delta-isomerase [Dehalococcoidia bacterium]